MAEPVQLPTPGYHVELRDLLKTAEPELWRWFTEATALASRRDDEAEVELLKSAYRLDGGVHDVLVAHASLLAQGFGIDAPVVLYQELRSGERNAQVFRLAGQIHVVFGGDMLDLLTPPEQHAVLAHELAHMALWSRADDEFDVLDQMVHRLVAETSADDVLIETSRRLRLHTEVWADAAAAAAVDALDVMVAAMVKMSSGLRHVDSQAYLRQAEEILALDSRATTAWTHPELHIRVACLAARERGAADEILATLINGPDDLDRLDLLGQRRLQQLTARVLRSGSTVATAATADSGQAIADQLAYFHDLNLIPTGSGAEPITDDELSAHTPSVRWYAAALLVDLALVDDHLDDLAGLRALSAEAARQGVAAEFDKILAKATDRPKPDIEQLRVSKS